MPHGTELCLTRVAHPPGRATPGRAPPAGPGSGRGRTAWCCCFTPAPGPATTGVSRGPGICIHHQPQAVLLPWAPAPSQNRWARGGRWVHGVGRTLLPFSPPRFKQVPPPALCRPWAPSALLPAGGHASRSDRGSRNFQPALCPGQGVFHVHFLFFSGAAGGRASHSRYATWWSQPGLQHSQHQHLLILAQAPIPPGFPGPGGRRGLRWGGEG